MPDKSQRPVFHDPKNRRWRWVRGALLVLGAATSVAFGVAAVSVLISPALPSLGLRSPRMLPGPGHLAPPQRKPWVLDARERAYQRARGELADARAAAARRGKVPERVEGAPQLSAFYVNWDDTSFTSLKMNLMSLDRLTAEWLHLAGTDGSVVVDDEEKADAVIAYVRALRPRMPVLVLINNFRSPTTGWEVQTLAGMLASPAARARTIQGILKFIEAKHLQGVNVDFESVPKKSYDDLVLFMGELHAACKPLGYEVAQSVPAEEEGWPYARLAQGADHLVLMAYDEHDAGSDPGPVASQGWFLRCVRARMAEVGAEKIVVALGNYGYDWREGDADGKEVSFQEAVLTAEESEGKIALDPVALNPAFDYYDEKDALHHVWFLNAVTLYNELVVAGPLKPYGYALWRLGSEDPSVWNIYGRRKTLGREQALSLETLHYGYDLDYEGRGEVLKVAATPKDGRRILRYNDATGLIDQERLESFPSPYVIERWGGQDPKKIALTFDDGPDAEYTPQILDILKAKQAPATFFVVGLEADRHSGLLKRMVAEGHEVGNHTFSHPNIALIPEQQFKFELNATERLFESRLGRGSVLFRPPYAEDVEPSTPEEVQPILLSSSLGYYTIGMLDDPSDWSQPGTASIVRAAVERALRGDAHVVLLHDGGGKREQTVEALPLLIDALRAKGFKLVGISELMGLSRDEVMPPARGGSPVVRGVDDVVFIVLGGSTVILYGLFMAGIVLGCARLVFIGLLAVVQRWLDHRRTFPADFAPPVSVVIPAFNEEKVVCQTVRTLLASEYPSFEIIVVDDGSKDGTFAVLQESFGQEPKVRLLTKANEGKAKALNEGIAHASGEIIVALDADTLFLPDTLAMLVRRFSDPEVGAVAGNAKVGNRLNLHTYYQALEYITSQNMDRRALDVMNCITVVPGSVGAWRKSLVLGAGGFTSTTLAEDADLTFSILEMGNKVAYEDAAVAYTEAPDTVRDFVKQRFRWMYGTLQAAWKHRRVLFRPRYGALGLFALPNVFLFQVIFPLISPVLDLFVVGSLLFTIVQERFHPNGDALHAFLHVLFYYSIFLSVDAAASVLAFLLERDEDWSLLLWLPLQRFIYRQLMYWVAMKSVYAAIKGRRVGWGQLERKATVGP